MSWQHFLIPKLRLAVPLWLVWRNTCSPSAPATRSVHSLAPLVVVRTAGRHGLRTSVKGRSRKAKKPG
eukprot:2361906-Prymnesium_polylepis.1